MYLILVKGSPNPIAHQTFKHHGTSFRIVNNVFYEGKHTVAIQHLIALLSNMYRKNVKTGCNAALWHAKLCSSELIISCFWTLYGKARGSKYVAHMHTKTAYRKRDSKLKLLNIGIQTVYIWFPLGWMMAFGINGMETTAEHMVCFSP